MILKLDRICIGIFIVSLLFMLPSIEYVKYVDELGCYTFGIIALLDIIVNRNYSRYKPIYFLILFLAFFVLYSVFFVHYNTTRYILKDAIIELKPYLPFFIVFALAPSLLDIEKQVIKIVSIVNVLACLVLMCLGTYITEKVVGHVAYLGTCCFISSITYLFVSVNADGSVSKKDIAIVVAMLVIGLGCTRSKYFGEFVIASFFLFLYRPGMLRKFNIMYALVIVLVIGVFVAVSWSKFSYYFITGNSETFDPEVAESFARPVLYATGGLILVDHFPFGSGLASFASYASAENYSSLYYEYGINNVWGLSQENNEFICDAYYPTLAQFGIVGIILFLFLFIWIYKKLRLLIRTNASKYKYHFIVGTLSICFLLIESVGGTFFVQTSGMLAMILIGFTSSQAKQEDALEYYRITRNKKTFSIKI